MYTTVSVLEIRLTIKKKKLITKYINTYENKHYRIKRYRRCKKVCSMNLFTIIQFILTCRAHILSFSITILNMQH